MTVEAPVSTSPASPPQLPRELLRALKRPSYEELPSGAPTWRRLIVWTLILLVAVGGLFSLGTSAAAADDGDSDDEFSSYSFYELGSEMTNLFSTIQDPGSDLDWDDDDTDWRWLLNNPGSAGSFLGYMDVGGLKSPSDWMRSQISSSSDSYGYESLVLFGQNTDDPLSSGSREAFYTYARYGSTLDALGLSNTRFGSGLNMGAIPGGLFWAVYQGATMVNWVMGGMIQVLSYLNPFAIFFEGVLRANPGTPGYAEAIGQPPEEFGPVVEWIGGIYSVLHDIGWGVMIPLFVGTLVMGLLFFKNMNRGSAIKKILIRMFFLVIGLPLLGMMYSSAINGLADATSDTNGAPARVALSTYVDFESWANNTRLRIPEGAVIEWDERNNEPTLSSEMATRSNALMINEMSHGLSGLVPKEWKIDGADANFSQEAFNTSSAITDKRAANVDAATNDILGRYLSGQTVSASSFENAITSGLSGWVRGDNYVDDAGDFATGLFRQITNNSFESDPEEGPNYFTGNDAAGRMAAYRQANEDYTARDLGSNPLISLTRNVADSDLRGLQADISRENGASIVRFHSLGDDNCGSTVLGSNGEAPHCNMAPVAMYNYLNTVFGTNAMTVYSSQNVSSLAVREAYTSVSVAGSGISSYMLWLSAFAMLASFFLIGITYALALAFGAIIRWFKIVSQVPFATLGAMGAIAKVIAYSIGLIIHLIMTVFLYVWVQWMIIVLPGVIENVMRNIINSLAGAVGGSALIGNALASVGVLPDAAPLMAGKAAVFGILFITIIVPVILCVIALRIRSAVIKTLDEMISKAIEKFTETTVSPGGSGGGLGGAMAGAGGSALGMAAANKMMSGGGKAQSSGAKSAKGNGPDPVRSAGGTGGGGPQGDSDSSGFRTNAAGNGVSTETDTTGSAHGIAGESAASTGTSAHTKAEGERVATSGLSMTPDEQASNAAPSCAVNTSTSGPEQVKDAAETAADRSTFVADSDGQVSREEDRPTAQRAAQTADEREATDRSDQAAQNAAQGGASTEQKKPGAANSTRKMAQGEAGKNKQRASSTASAQKSPQAAQSRPSTTSASKALPSAAHIASGKPADRAAVAAMALDERRNLQKKVAAAHRAEQERAGVPATPPPVVNADGSISAMQRTPDGKLEKAGEYQGAVETAPAPATQAPEAAETPSAARQAAAAAVGATTARATTAVLGGDQQTQAQAATTTTKHAAELSQIQRRAERGQGAAPTAPKPVTPPTKQKRVTAGQTTPTQPTATPQQEVKQKAAAAAQKRPAPKPKPAESAPSTAPAPTATPQQVKQKVAAAAPEQDAAPQPQPAESAPTVAAAPQTAPAVPRATAGSPMGVSTAPTQPASAPQPKAPTTPTIKSAPAPAARQTPAGISAPSAAPQAPGGGGVQQTAPVVTKRKSRRTAAAPQAPAPVKVTQQVSKTPQLAKAAANTTPQQQRQRQRGTMAPVNIPGMSKKVSAPTPVQPKPQVVKPSVKSRRVTSAPTRAQQITDVVNVEDTEHTEADGTKSVTRKSRRMRRG